MPCLCLICGADQPPFDPERTLAVLMSGGVDSSVTALLLRAAGWRVIGVHMRIPLACGGAVDLDSVEQVCRSAGITLYRFDAQAVFQEKVIGHFRAEYQRGRTPNPCCDCNRELKFGALWDIIEAELGVRHLATGHYARIVREGGQTLLRRGANPDKDQSYFIYGIPPHRLPFFHLPLGDLHSKEETRELARQAQLPVAEKSESMELCFAGGGDYRAALEADHPTGHGPFLSVNDEVLGEHEGIEFYTVGQRKLGRSFGPEPFYVLRILPERNAVVVGTRAQALTATVRARIIALHQSARMLTGAACNGKIRSAGQPVPCRIRDWQPTENMAEVEFARPLFAPTAGQHLVLYDDTDAVICGGVIER